MTDSEPDIQNLQSEMTEIETEVGQLKSQLEVLEEKAAAEKDKVLRAYAELENFKRRKEQEKESFVKFAHEEFVKVLLPVLDSFDRALEHTKDDGFLLIQKQLVDALAKVGVKTIEAQGKPFDPNLHQAVSQEEKEGAESHTVLKDMQKGYMLHDRVVRPSMVVVSK